jgi:RNA polymerase sigma-70 factor (ECF subfamily)
LSGGDEIDIFADRERTNYWHTIKADTKEKWESILQLYNQLLLIEYSPIAALNRTYALQRPTEKGKRSQRRRR